MTLPRSGHGRLGLKVIELADQERPPMVRIPGVPGAAPNRRRDGGRRPAVSRSATTHVRA